MSKKEKFPSFIINKTDHGMVKVQVNEYKGKMYLDVRSFYLDKTSREFKPTPKGCSIPLEKAKSFYIRTKKLVAAAEEMGLQVEPSEE